VQRSRSRRDLSFPLPDDGLSLSLSLSLARARVADRRREREGNTDAKRRPPPFVEPTNARQLHREDVTRFPHGAWRVRDLSKGRRAASVGSIASN